MFKSALSTVGEIELPLSDMFRTTRVPVVTSGGGIFEKVVPFGMPVLGYYNRLLRNVFFLYPSREAAETGEPHGGSGFLMTVPSERFPDRHYCYAVTNWHVACRGSSVVRINRHDGGHDIFDLDPSDWYFDAQGPDLAVALLALNGKVHDAQAINTSWCVTQTELTEMEIGPGDDVFMIGRFIDYDGAETNLPSLRFGNISILAAPIRQPNGSYSDSVVLDMHSRTGYSGSPVFVYRTSGSYFGKYDEENPGNSSIWLGHTMKLLGVHWGQFPERWELKSKEDASEASSLITDGAYVSGLSGMTCCVPSSELLRVLYMPKLKNDRRKQDSELDAALARSGKEFPQSESAMPEPDEVLRRLLNSPPTPHKRPKGDE